MNGLENNAKGRLKQKMAQNDAAKTKLAQLMQAVRIPSAQYQANVRTGFGVKFFATQKQFNDLLDAAEKVGLEIDLREYDEQTESHMEPGYQYRVFVVVPDDWKPE